jgi:fatty acid-binding protein DegV
MLHYLVRFKRLGKVSAYFRALFNIKPVITIDNEDGAFHSVAKVKSPQQALNYFLKKIEAELSLGGKHLHVAVVHADEAQEAEKLYAMIAREFNCAELYLQELTPAMGCYTGPGVIGVNFYVS